MNVKLRLAFELMINDGRLFKHTDPAQAVENLEDIPDVDALSVSIFGSCKIPKSVALPKLVRLLDAVESHVGYKPSLILGSKIGFEATMRRALEQTHDVLINPFSNNEMTNMSINEATKIRDIRTLQLSNIAVFFVKGTSAVVNPAYMTAINNGALVSVIRV